MTPQAARAQLTEAILGLEDELTTFPMNSPEDTLQREGHIAVRVSIGEQTFTLVHSMAPELCDTAYLETHFGTVPAQQRDEAYRQLLELNFSWMAVQSRGFGIDKASGDVILTVALPIEQLSAPYLAACMDATRGLAMVWQERHSFRMDPSVDFTNTGSVIAHAIDARA